MSTFIQNIKGGAIASFQIATAIDAVRMMKIKPIIHLSNRNSACEGSHKHGACSKYKYHRFSSQSSWSDRSAFGAEEQSWRTVVRLTQPSKLAENVKHF